MSRQLIYTGKAKDIYTTSEDENLIISVYKDQATMLNGARKETIKGKGVLNNQISSLIFTKLNEAGVATHFVKQLSETEQLNKKVDIVPLEVVLRNVTAGSFSKRFGVEEGIKLDTPIVEFYYKNDELDENGKSLKWKVENSWGDKVGNKGYFVASDAWMDEFTYQIVVRKEFLTAEERAAYEAEPIVLAPWDPMGALASK
jgi:phosphoribosylaminoimidazole-succinocarboxamide synthase